MRNTGSPAELEHRRRLAVQRVLDGFSSEEVADFLGVDVSSVRRWVRVFRRHGWSGLVAEAPCGRPGKLIRQEWRVAFNARYLPRWLKVRGFSCQKPERVPRERNDEAIAAWIQTDWKRIKKKRTRNVRA